MERIANEAIQFEFQSTPPRGGRLGIKRTLITNPAVSIHAPARGATYCALVQVGQAGVSIHAPARGATAAASISASHGSVSIHAPAGGDMTGSSPAGLAQFQSTPPRGGRLAAASISASHGSVSIHAPRGGATEPQ